MEIFKAYQRIRVVVANNSPSTQAQLLLHGKKGQVRKLIRSTGCAWVLMDDILPEDLQFRSDSDWYKRQIMLSPNECEPESPYPNVEPSPSLQYPQMTESQLQKAVLDYLAWQANSKPLYFFRSAAGMVKTEQGRVFKTGKSGCPDISLIYGGIYYGLEIKSATGRQSAHQKQAQTEIEAAGGRYIVVRGLSQVKEIIG